MSETLYATFNDPTRAQTAADGLLNLGIRPDQISLFMNKESRQKESSLGVDLEDTRLTMPMTGTEFHKGFDPMSNDLRQNSVARIEQGVDPAQEHMRGPSDKPELGSLPRESRGYNAYGADSPVNIKVDPDADAYRDTDTHVVQGATAADVASGAAQGAGIGLGVGAAAAVATMLIPGLGLVVGGDVLAAAMVALVTGAGAGAIAGGLAGFLTEHGVPAENAVRYSEIFEKGGAILAVTIADPSLRDSVDQVLAMNGAAEVEMHQAYLS